MTLAVSQPINELHEALDSLSLEPSSANRALLASKGSGWRLGHGKLPRELGKKQVLVRNTVVGLTPYDWQSVAYGFGITGTPRVQGRDGAGVVISAGDNVEHLKEGDRVWFCANPATLGSGSFQEYSIHDAAEVGRTPEHISDEQAATLGSGLLTAGVALFRTLKLDMSDLRQSRTDRWFLVWGGAGSTGVFLIQLAHLLGYRVICAASPVNHEYLESLGADVVLDRWSTAEDLVRQIREVTDDGVLLAVDNVGKETAALCRRVVQGSKRHCATTSEEAATLLAIAGLPEAGDDDDAIRTVNTPRISFSTTFFGHPDFSRQLLDTLYELLDAKLVKPTRLTLLEGGLDEVQNGLDTLRKRGNVNGTRLVVPLDQ